MRTKLLQCSSKRIKFCKSIHFSLMINFRSVFVPLTSCAHVSSFPFASIVSKYLMKENIKIFYIPKEDYKTASISHNKNSWSTLVQGYQLIYRITKDFDKLKFSLVIWILWTHYKLQILNKICSCLKFYSDFVFVIIYKCISRSGKFLDLNWP